MYIRGLKFIQQFNFTTKQTEQQTNTKASAPYHTCTHNTVLAQYTDLTFNCKYTQGSMFDPSDIARFGGSLTLWNCH